MPTYVVFLMHFSSLYVDYAMSPETVIVGDDSSRFQSTNNYRNDINAGAALVFAVDKNKPSGNIKIYTCGYM